MEFVDYNGNDLCKEKEIILNDISEVENLENGKYMVTLKKQWLQYTKIKVTVNKSSDSDYNDITIQNFDKNIFKYFNNGYIKCISSYINIYKTTMPHTISDLDDGLLKISNVRDYKCFTRMIMATSNEEYILSGELPVFKEADKNGFVGWVGLSSAWTQNVTHTQELITSGAYIHIDSKEDNTYTLDILPIIANGIEQSIYWIIFE